MNDENRSNENPETLVSVPVHALRQVLDLAEMGRDDRSEYLNSFYGRVDYGAELDDALDTLAAQDRAMDTLRNCLKRSEESDNHHPDSGSDEVIEKAYTVVFQLPDFLPGCGGGDTCVWVSHTHGRFWSDAVRNAAYAACDAIDGIEDKYDLAVLLAFEGHHQDRVEANSTLHATAPEDGSGYWDEDPDFTVEDWQYEVGNDDTRESYWGWVAKQREAAREEAAI
ncbi:hypothetical protein [Thioalkalivibrio sp. ALE19]|uniref:hypothetical protein n=1 Tax=Thioalkalivibrio sp. ALE19 TaxID=1266909 RepID=UPI00040155E4|nr:hypothetical protein [Thioalkalivibrio sp. ALE19]